MKFFSNQDADYTNVKDDPEARAVAALAHDFIGMSGDEIWKLIAPGLFAQLNAGTGHEPDAPDFGSFVNSPVIKGIFFCGMANGFTNAAMGIKRGQEEMERRTREAN